MLEGDISPRVRTSNARVQEIQDALECVVSKIVQSFSIGIADIDLRGVNK
jgi:hypothetical protein